VQLAGLPNYTINEIAQLAETAANAKDRAMVTHEMRPVHSRIVTRPDRQVKRKTTGGERFSTPAGIHGTTH
jgi:hypothetical protein